MADSPQDRARREGRPGQAENGEETAVPDIKTSAICRIEWSDSTLSIWFRPAGRYDYHGVPERIYLDFLAAPSRGDYYTEHIRERY